MTDSFNTLVNKPSLLTVIRAFQQETYSKLNCVKLAIIDEVLTNNEVRCSVVNKRLMRTNTDGSSVWKNYPPIIAKVYYMGSAGTGIDYPISANTLCLLLFNDREYDSYFATGEISPLSDTRMHSLNDAICLPFYQSANTGDLTLKGDTITLNATTINLNATTVNINGELIINGKKYLEHTHSNGNQGNPTGGVL